MARVGRPSKRDGLNLRTTTLLNETIEILHEEQKSDPRVPALYEIAHDMIQTEHVRRKIDREMKAANPPAPARPLTPRP